MFVLIMSSPWKWPFDVLLDSNCHPSCHPVRWRKLPPIWLLDLFLHWQHLRQREISPPLTIHWFLNPELFDSHNVPTLWDNRKIHSMLCSEISDGSEHVTVGFRLIILEGLMWGACTIPLTWLATVQWCNEMAGLLLSVPHMWYLRHHCLCVSFKGWCAVPLLPPHASRAVHRTPSDEGANFIVELCAILQLILLCFYIRLDLSNSWWISKRESSLAVCFQFYMFIFFFSEFCLNILSLFIFILFLHISKLMPVQCWDKYKEEHEAKRKIQMTSNHLQAVQAHINSSRPAGL